MKAASIITSLVGIGVFIFVIVLGISQFDVDGPNKGEAAATGVTILLIGGFFAFIFLMVTQIVALGFLALHKRRKVKPPKTVPPIHAQAIGASFSSAPLCPTK